MIRYALVCDHGHEFEGWFAASSDFDQQAGQARLECPMCGASNVRKQIMAPAVSASTRREPAAPAMRAMMMEAMGRVRAHVEETFDYVGDRFAAEARSIHDGEVEARGIYGEATPREVRDLLADGVPVSPLPPAAPTKTELN